MVALKGRSVSGALCAASARSKLKKKLLQKRQRRNDEICDNVSDIHSAGVFGDADHGPDAGRTDTTCAGWQTRPERFLAGPQHRRLGPRIPGWRSRAERRTHARCSERNSTRIGRGRRRKDPVSTLGSGQAERESQELARLGPGSEVSAPRCTASDVSPLSFSDTPIQGSTLGRVSVLVCSPGDLHGETGSRSEEQTSELQSRFGISY